MAFAPRTSPARRTRLLEGRLRFAALAAGAAVSGTAVPVALAGDGDHPACADPARTAATVTLPDGQVLDCTAPAAPAATGTTEAPTAPPEAVEPPPTQPEAPAPPPPPQEPAAPPQQPPAPPPVPAEQPPAPQAEQPTAPAVEPAAQPEREPAAAPARPASTAAATTEPTRPAARRPGTQKPAAGPPAPERPGPGTSRRQGEDDAEADGPPRPAPDAKELPAPAGAGPAVPYGALPAAWTSLAPLELPSSDVEGFPIPEWLLPIYQAAAAEYGVPWEVLASINEIETDFGRNAGISSAGAMGWMQFIPSSWERWGTDGDADQRRDPRNPVDAIFAAARYLRDAGAADDLPKAIFAYNHAGWYVERVVRRAREFAGLDRAVVSALTHRALREDLRVYRARGNPFAGEGAIAPSPGQALLLSKEHLTRLVLKSPGIRVYAGGRRDIAAGGVDRRVLAVLVFLERSGLSPTVSSLTTGHGVHTASGNVSAHSYGHAVDIAAIDGTSIAGNQGPGSITAKALDELVALQGHTAPNQIISLMTIAGRDTTMAMGDHDDHIHVGFPRVADVAD